MNTPLTLTCPAKINLALSVGAPLPNGFHPIASWMCRVSLHDDLTITPLPADAPSTFNIDWAPDAPQPSPIDWPLTSDLGYRAHQILQQHTNQQLPINYNLAKRIPVGAGMAGGSTNAAATFIALNQLFDLNLPNQTLADLSAKLGSDIPFFFGPPSAIVTGFGEIIQPSPITTPLHLAMIFPPLHCNTAAVYKTFDSLAPADATPDPSRVRNLAATSPLPPDAPFNDLAAPACKVQPQLADIRDRIAHATGQPVHVTGSGAALFIIAKDPQNAAQLAQQAHQATGAPALPLSTL